METLSSAKESDMTSPSSNLGQEPNHREPVGDRISADREASGEADGLREAVEV